MLDAGVSDWGGVSPVTLDFVNPERAWPAVDQLRDSTESAGNWLAPRLPSYPKYCTDGVSVHNVVSKWHSDGTCGRLMALMDAEGLARGEEGGNGGWTAGCGEEYRVGGGGDARCKPGGAEYESKGCGREYPAVSRVVRGAIEAAESGKGISVQQVPKSQTFNPKLQTQCASESKRR